MNTQPISIIGPLAIVCGLLFTSCVGYEDSERSPTDSQNGSDDTTSDADSSTVCCKCTCLNENFTTPTADFYFSGANLDCSKSCVTKCTVEKNYLEVQAASTASCDEISTTVCCKCTCYNENFITPTRDFYMSGEDLDCNKGCKTKCTVEENYEEVQAQGVVSCDVLSTDT